MIQEVLTVQYLKNTALEKHLFSNYYLYEKSGNDYILIFQNPAKGRFKWKIINSPNPKVPLAIYAVIIESFTTLEICYEILDYVNFELPLVENVYILSRWNETGNWLSYLP